MAMREVTASRPKRLLTDEEMQNLRCSLCGKAKREVARLFIAPRGDTFICSECVFLLHGILREEGIMPASEP